MKQKKEKTRAVYLASLGCPKNLVDSEVISGSLLSNDWGWSDSPEHASLYVINTCAFLPAARAEARDEILAAINWKAEKAGRKIVVAGCLCAHKEAADFRKAFPEVDLWAGVNDIARIPELLESSSAPDTGEPVFLLDETMPHLQLTLPHLAYLKIADGCNNRCAYCSIPNLRGALRSRTEKSVLEEAQVLIDQGVKELVVVAQDITAFGYDRPASGENLASLLRKLNAMEGEFCIRLLYTHPAHYTEELIDVLAAGGKILPYLDIPLQHISDRLLKAMNRHTDAASIRALLASLRKRIPNLSLRTTFITGLPGETDEEFAELEAFAAEMKFERMGVFSYAAEPGTPAAAMPDQVPNEIAEKRAKKLLSNQIARMKRMHRKLLGSTQKVLVDYLQDGVAVCRGAMDAPEIDNVVFVPKPKRAVPGDFIRVRIANVDRCDMIAERI